MNAKLFACLMVCLLFTLGCEKDKALEQVETEQDVLSMSKAIKDITICKKGKIKMINIKKLEKELAKGAILLTDVDGDGYVAEENNCGIPVDCDPNDPMLNKSCLDCFASDILENLTPLDGSCMIIMSISDSEQLKLTIITSDGTLDYKFRMIIEQYNSGEIQNYNLNGQYFKDDQVYTINHGRDHVNLSNKDVYTYCFGIMNTFAETHDFQTCLR